MVDVNFDEHDWQPSSRFVQASEPSSLAKLVLKTGIVKDISQVNYVLIAVAVIFFAATIYYLVSPAGGSGSKKTIIKKYYSAPLPNGAPPLPPGVPK